MSEYFRKPIVKVLMLKGQEGQSIKSITKTGTDGLVDTYTITLTDGTTSTFTVTNNIPSGGITGQFLKKKSNNDYDYAWATIEAITNDEIDSICV